jgi:hypothetical protein
VHAPKWGMSHGSVGDTLTEIYMKLNPSLKIYTQAASWVYNHSFVECDLCERECVSKRGYVKTGAIDSMPSMCKELHFHLHDSTSLTISLQVKKVVLVVEDFVHTYFALPERQMY